MTHLWLDDVCPPPDDTWTWVKTVDDALAMLRTGKVDHASFDHDLGARLPATEKSPILAYDFDEPDGTMLVKHMVREGLYPNKSIVVHSVNRVGAERMMAKLRAEGPDYISIRWQPDYHLRRQKPAVQ